MIKIIFILCFVSIQAFGIEDNLYEVKNIKISLVDIETNLAREIANEKAIAFAFEKVLSWILTNSQYNKLISTEKITKDLRLGSIPEWDSLAHLNIYFELQKVFKKKMSIQKAANVKSVKDWVKLLNNRL